MEKRIFAAIAISVALLWIWAAIAPRIFPELARKPPAPVSVPATARTLPARPGPPAATASATTSTLAPVPSTPPADVAPIVPVAEASVIATTVDTPEFVAVFSNRGAQLVSFKLHKYKDKKSGDVELVKERPSSRSDFPFAIESQNGAVASRLNAALYAVDVARDDRDNVRSIAYHYAGDGVSVTKTFKFGSAYLFDFHIAVSPPIPYRTVIGPGLRVLGPDERDSRIIITGNGIVQREGSLDVLPREKGDRLRIYGPVDFVGVEDNYFLTVLRPKKGDGAVLRRVDLQRGPEVRKELYAGVNAGADGVVAGNAFFGPKETKLLDRYGLASTLQFGTFGIIARFLLDVLVWLNQATRNYGWAIIVLTIIIKVVLYPLQHKSIVSMKKMQKVQPKMEAIKNRYKKARTDPEQRNKMNTEMMKLYQQEGINPMSGCIPIVLQLPILWGFYGLLSKAIELRGAPFLLWIHDLSDKDPFYVTPLLMTITMFIQTWITPTTGDASQRRIFLIMPLVFGFIFKDMPSGLVLYWLVQNILTIVQQMIMNKWWKDHPTELQTA
ncbi:MAG: membrane protein insertase YidC [Thermoanaerobaculia bacterium]